MRAFFVYKGKIWRDDAAGIVPPYLYPAKTLAFFLLICIMLALFIGGNKREVSAFLCG
jgi:hypothetical protein